MSQELVHWGEDPEKSCGQIILIHTDTQYRTGRSIDFEMQNEIL